MKKILITAATCMLGTLAYTPLATAFGVGLQPSSVEMTVKEGDRQRQVITIGNVHTEKTIALQLSLADWSLDEEGQLVLDAPGDTERSAADWVRFSPASLTLKPATSADVVVEITTPYKVQNKGDHRFALLATTRLPDPKDRDGSGVWAKYQLASLFYLTFQPAESLPSVQAKLDGSELMLDIANTGDAHARIQGSADLVSKTGDVVQSMEVNAVVLDGGRRTLRMDIGGDEVSPGTYAVQFNLDNAFSPQNNFERTAISVPDMSYEAR